MTEDMKGKILVPTDFSETTRNAIDHAVHLADIRGFKVVLLHVINRESKAQLKKEKRGLEEILKRLDALKEENGRGPCMPKIKSRQRVDSCVYGIGVDSNQNYIVPGQIITSSL